MDAKETAAPAEGSPLVQWLQPQLGGTEQKAPSEFVGGGATVTTDADAPPGYSEVLKEMPPVASVGILPGQPQLMYIQPVPQPGAIIQPGQYMGLGAPVSANGKYHASNDFLIFSAITSIVCGIFSISTLFCTIPAVLFSYLSMRDRLRGAYQTANGYSSCALALNISAIVCGLIGVILGVGIFLGLFYQACFITTRCPGS